MEKARAKRAKPMFLIFLVNMQILPQVALCFRCTVLISLITDMDILAVRAAGGELTFQPSC